MPLRQRLRTHRHGNVAHIEEFTDFLYARLQRRGYLRRDCERLVYERAQRVRAR
jgi:malate dehydrogenase (oxaloacetate-decarboxylating)(NADP+)